MSPLRTSAFALSTCPLLRGCATDAKHSWMPMSSQYSWNSLLLNWVPLSVMLRLGTPNLHTMDLRNVTTDFFCDVNHRGNLRPFCEFVNGDVEEPVPADGPGGTAPGYPRPIRRTAMRAGSFAEPEPVCVFALHGTRMLCRTLPAQLHPRVLSAVEAMPKGLTTSVRDEE